MLYLIPTPIGNLEDITLRALRLLRELPVLICEDTRTTKSLLSKLDIAYQDKQFVSLTSFTGQGKLDHYIDLIREQEVGLVSDAGTPWLSDPGNVMIKLCHEQGLPYSILPGATALIPAVVGAAFPTTQWSFWWFLPTKKGRQTAITNICQSEYPVFVYESVHRMGKLLEQLEQAWFQWQISIAREVSKMHEQLITGTLEEVKQMWEEESIVHKGEFVVGMWQS